MEYLKRLYRKIQRKWKGSLVKVEEIRKEEPNAKEYLSKLAKAGLIEKVVWGWYWVPDKVEDVWDFLRKDKNFKVISSQTAASFWNYDFIHRDVYIVKVANKSYGKALRTFAQKRGWNLNVKYEDPSKMAYTKIKGLFVEDMKDAIVSCLQNWAFADAFAVLYANRKRIKIEELKRRSYWKRISGSDVRVRQVLEYGLWLMNKHEGKELFHVRKTSLEDSYIRREIEEAVEKVMELG